jgi:hypothetical protein
MMTRNLRLALFVLGVVVMLCSLAALAYAYWPTETLSAQSTVAPTLFSPP